MVCYSTSVEYMYLKIKNIEGLLHYIEINVHCSQELLIRDFIFK